MLRQRYQSQWWLLPSLLVFRCVNALLVQTFFDPDEYWQSLEVAHRLVFGYGYITWEWREGIRGYAHPLIFAALYKGLAILGWDSPEAVRLAPRLLQGAFAAAGDWFLFKLTTRAFSRKAARLALACQLLNWFTFYCIVRPYSNCVETVLTTAALSYWPLAYQPIHPPNRSATKHSPCLTANQAFNGEGPAANTGSIRQAETNEPSEPVRQSGASQWGSLRESRAARKESQRQAEADRFSESERRNRERCTNSVNRRNGIKSNDGENRPLALFLAGLACVVRPTSAVLWSFLGVRELIRTRDKSRLVFREVIPIGVLCLGTSTLLDRWMYGEWTVVPFNFVRFNLSGGADAYGTHPWHWYFTGGLPAMATTILPFAALGIWRSRQRALAYVILWVLGAYSLLGHKEFRFILPVLSLVMAFAGQGLATVVPEREPAFSAAPTYSPAAPKQDSGSDSCERNELFTERMSSAPEPDKRFPTAVSGAAGHPFPSALTRRKPFVTEQPSADVTRSSADVTRPSADAIKHSADGIRPPADVTNSSAEAAGFANPSADAGHDKTFADVTTPANDTPADVTSTPRTQKPAPKALRFVLLFLALTQIPMALYFSLVHQRGAVRAAEYLADEARRGRVSGIWFLTPCHATPFYSHVHAPVPMRILDCAPSSMPGEDSEDARFHRAPSPFLTRDFGLLRNPRATGKPVLNVGRKTPTWRQLIGSAAEGLDDRLPSHVVLFDSVEKAVEGILTDQGYVKGPRFFHSHFAVDRELQSHVVVYLLTPQQHPG